MFEIGDRVKCSTCGAESIVKSLWKTESKVSCMLDCGHRNGSGGAHRDLGTDSNTSDLDYRLEEGSGDSPS